MASSALAGFHISLIQSRPRATIITTTNAALSLPFLRAPKAEQARRPVLTAGAQRRRTVVRAGGPGATPPELSQRVEQSIKKAEETCASDPKSGECVAAWDEVEELSAAASHKRDAIRATDPLEEYCKEHPETEECRTYED